MILRLKLLKDLKSVGIETDFTLDLRGYSKTYDGRYHSKEGKIVIYAREEDGNLRKYSELLEIAIHESVHHYQWRHDPKFVRLRGVMHNADFWKRYDMLMTKAKEKGIMKEDDKDDKEFSSNMGGIYRAIL